MGSLWQPTMLKVATCVVPREIISMLITLLVLRAPSRRSAVVPVGLKS